VRRASPDLISLDDYRLNPCCTLILCYTAPNFVAGNLVAASDLLHAAVIPPDRHCPAAGAAEPALISIVVAVMALSPTRPAHVNPHASRTNVHTLRKRRYRSRGSQCARHSERSYRCLNPHWKRRARGRLSDGGGMVEKNEQ
jgi:hypothetical protein